MVRAKDPLSKGGAEGMDPAKVRNGRPWTCKSMRTSVHLGLSINRPAEGSILSLRRYLEIVSGTERTCRIPDMRWRPEDKFQIDNI